MPLAMVALAATLLVTAPEESPLPEIGRTRAATPACAAMRDLVIPSFAAARRADARFAETQVRLPKYAEIKAENEQEAFRESALFRLEQDAANLLGYAAFISKALGDPRLAASSTDPDVQEERKRLQALYEMQQARANMLAEFAQRERVGLTRSQVDAMRMKGKLAAPTATDPPPIPSPLPGISAPPGMPLFSGIAFADKAAARAWGAGIAKAVAASENDAAKSFLQLATRCNSAK